MNSVEIRLRKKMVVTFIVTGLCMTLVIAFVVFFTEKYKNNTVSHVGFIFSVLAFVYFTHRPIKKLIRNEPIIAFTEDSIILNTEKNVVIPRAEVKQMSVEKNDSGYFLVIKTEKEIHRTNISWLERTPDQINNLIKQYRQ